ncbi:unnamed protein product [Amoebophrya sp. A120]|nr:unnamed protein product [Amoebophrya sp. A120]|eukprot:GSA120T00009621001.1
MGASSSSSDAAPSGGAGQRGSRTSRDRRGGQLPDLAPDATMIIDDGTAIPPGQERQSQEQTRLLHNGYNYLDVPGGARSSSSGYDYNFAQTQLQQPRILSADSPVKEILPDPRRLPKRRPPAAPAEDSSIFACCSSDPCCGPDERQDEIRPSPQKRMVRPKGGPRSSGFNTGTYETTHDAELAALMARSPPPMPRSSVRLDNYHVYNGENVLNEARRESNSLSSMIENFVSTSGSASVPVGLRGGLDVPPLLYPGTFHDYRDTLSQSRKSTSLLGGTSSPGNSPRGATVIQEISLNNYDDQNFNTNDRLLRSQNSRSALEDKRFYNSGANYAGYGSGVVMGGGAGGSVVLPPQTSLPVPLQVIDQGPSLDQYQRVGGGSSVVNVQPPQPQTPASLVGGSYAAAFRAVP